MAQQWRLFWLAVVYFTRLPAPRGLALGEEPPERAVRFFPLAGGLAAVLSAAVLTGAARLWPPELAAALAVAAMAWLTGGIHEDGLADTFDGLGGGRDVASRLAIMRDSRLGSFGALALLATVLLRVLALAALLRALGAGGAAAAWVAVQVMARALAAGLMASLPYARWDEAAGKATAVVRSLRRGDWLLALATGAAACAAWGAAVSAMQAALALAVLAGMWLGWRRTLQTRLGGYTGDTLGAAEQGAEVALLLILLV